MKTLTQAWELIQLLSSLRLLSPTLVRAANPQTYTFYCSYNPEHEGPLHIDICNEESCEYYIRIRKCERGWGAGAVVNGTIWTVGGVLTVFTGGLSGLVIMPLSWVSNFLIGTSINANLRAIENELKLVQEIEQAEQELNDLEDEFKVNFEEALKASDSWHGRIIKKQKEIIKLLKQELCRISGCNKYPNCIHGENNQ
jgi:hypothetical protein